MKASKNQAMTNESQTEIKDKLYLVTSYYSNDKTLEEVLLQAIKRDVNSYENDKADEKSSHSSYNDVSNIFSR